MTDGGTEYTALKCRGFGAALVLQEGEKGEGAEAVGMEWRWWWRRQAEGGAQGGIGSLLLLHTFLSRLCSTLWWEEGVGRGREHTVRGRTTMGLR